MFDEQMRVRRSCDTIHSITDKRICFYFVLLCTECLYSAEPFLKNESVKTSGQGYEQVTLMMYNKNIDSCQNNRPGKNPIQYCGSSENNVLGNIWFSSSLETRYNHHYARNNLHRASAQNRFTNSLQQLDLEQETTWYAPCSDQLNVEAIVFVFVDIFAKTYRKYSFSFGLKIVMIMLKQISHNVLVTFCNLCRKKR